MKSFAQFVSEDTESDVAFIDAAKKTWEYMESQPWYEEGANSLIDSLIDDSTMNALATYVYKVKVTFIKRLPVSQFTGADGYFILVIGKLNNGTHASYVRYNNTTHVVVGVDTQASHEEMITSFVHEMNHFFSDRRSGGKSMRSAQTLKRNSSAKDYYTDPDEVNSHVLQYISRLRDYGRDKLQELVWGKSDVEAVKALTDLIFFHYDPKRRLRDSIKGTKAEKRFYGRLTQAVRDHILPSLR